ncbi:MAG TPA: PQQ-dependent sugar dehydrogenase, partial [Chloroflexota bacterium]|nr:PQQ-dependent sugar dehydrogenase [Chloroflexota bacterium]
MARSFVLIVVVLILSVTACQPAASTAPPSPTAASSVAAAPTTTSASAASIAPTATGAPTLAPATTPTALSTATAAVTAAPVGSPTAPNIAAKATVVASWDSQDVGKLTDGNPDSLWNSQLSAPQWVSLVYDKPYQINRIELVVAQAPAGKTSHEIWLEDATGTFAPFTTLKDLDTHDGQVIDVPIEPARAVRRVMIRTIASPSYVAWREIRVFGAPAAPKTLPPLASSTWPAVQIKPFLAKGLTQPDAIVNAHDGSGRLFVVQQTGQIRVVQKDGTLLPTPFLDLHTHVACCGEMGMVGLAFPPDFPKANHFYVAYTTNEFGPKGTKIGDLILARFNVSSDPNVADPQSQENLLIIPEPSAVHHSGHLAFGPDGYLYMGSGDGGPENDPNHQGQDPNTLHGKILRLDVESGVKPYGIPKDNPFVSTPGYRPEIWATGLRNPWSFSWDTKTGALYIADVGQAEFEEVDVQPAGSHGGENYGWSVMEANHCFNAQSCDAGSFV